MSDETRGTSGGGGDYKGEGDHAHPEIPDGHEEGRTSQAGGYEVGYRRPPKSTRFVKGQSGNLKGRPKGAASLGALIAKSLRRKVVVRENGRERKAEAGEVIVASLTNKAMKGDLTASRFLFEQMEAARLPGETGLAPTFETLGKDDLAVIENYFRGRYGEPSEPFAPAGSDDGVPPGVAQADGANKADLAEQPDAAAPGARANAL